MTLRALLMSSLLAMSGIGYASAEDHSAISQDPTVIDEAYPPAIIELHFESAGNRLNGLLYQANGAGPHPTIILLHGYPGVEKNLDLAQILRRDGFNVLFFHYRGSWGSEGEFSFTHVIEDVGVALDMLRTRAADYRVDPAYLTVIGHSMGGFAALQGAARDQGVKCVGSLAGADFGAIAGFIEATPEATTGFSAYSDSLQMLAGWSGEKAIAELIANKDAFGLKALAPKLAGKSVLLIAADKDASVPAGMQHVPLVAAYEETPEIDLTHTILSGDHSFSWSRITLAEAILNWAEGCKGE